MPGGAIGVRGRPGELQVALERLFERDGIGLRVDDDPLVVGDRPADVRVGPLDRRRASTGSAVTAFGTRSHSISRTYATRGRDDQAIGLEHARPGGGPPASRSCAGSVEHGLGLRLRRPARRRGRARACRARVGGASCLAARR